MKIGGRIVIASLFALCFTLPPFAPVQAAEDGQGARIVAIGLDDDSPLMACLRTVDPACRLAESAVPAIARLQPAVLVVDAAPETIGELADDRDRLQPFLESGGWIVLCGLFPDGLNAFNRLVGVDHLIRPFIMEEVDLPRPPDPLLKGLTPSDVFLESGTWTPEPDAAPLRADNMFTYIVDTGNIAPFCEMPPDKYWQTGGAKAGTDRWPANLVNGLTYHWRFGLTIPVTAARQLTWPMRFPREETVIGFDITPGDLNHRITELRLDFHDGNAPVTLPVEPAGLHQHFDIDSRRTDRLTVTVTRWDDHGRNDTVAVRNLEIRVARSDDFRRKVQPLLNIGGLVKYPVGKGGILLNQLHILDEERNPVNVEKKRKIAHVLLQNLCEGL